MTEVSKVFQVVVHDAIVFDLDLDKNENITKENVYDGLPQRDKDAIALTIGREYLATGRVKAGVDLIGHAMPYKHFRLRFDLS